MMKNSTVPIFLLGMLVAPAAWPAAPDATITVTGTANEPVQAVTVATAIGSVTATVSGTTFSAAGVPLAFGSNVITVTATDPLGNTGSASITVHVGPKSAIQGTVSDASAVTVAVNGVPASIAGGVFTAEIPLPLGVNAVTAIATDAAGNTKSATVEVFVARTPVSHP